LILPCVFSEKDGIKV